ncbi:hypothetical protein GCM10027569_02750 [Flindersiella endophytica]
MARRLLETAGDDQVVVWNRSTSRADALAAAGALVAATPAEAVSTADVVITMLADGPAVEAVLFGPDGVAGAIRPDACLVEMSTVGPTALLDVAKRLGAGVVDAPVLGSVDKAAAGELTILAGGEVSTSVEAVLARLGTVRRCGPLGSGAALKLVVNAGMIASLAVLDETLRLAGALNLPAELVRAALAEGPLARAYQRAQSSTGQFAVTSAAKDLDLALAAYPTAALLAAARRRLGLAVEHGLARVDVRAIVEEN